MTPSPGGIASRATSSSSGCRRRRRRGSPRRTSSTSAAATRRTRSRSGACTASTSPCGRRGIAARVLGGWSAGANCWFEDSVTDSYGPRLRELGGGLGLLAGSFCPHFDGEPERRPTYTRLVRDGVLPPGYAADDDAAFHFEGTELREVVSQREGARGYRIGVDGEQPLDARSL